MRKARSPAELGFTGHDRSRLATAFHQAQEAKVHKRVQAALLIAQDYSLDEVARIIGSQRRSVYYWTHRYLDHHRAADLYDASRAGRPRTAAQINKARILRGRARNPLKLGYNTSIWTVALLASQLSQRYHSQITPRRLRRRMKEVGLRRKRPRHVVCGQRSA